MFEIRCSGARDHLRYEFERIGRSIVCESGRSLPEEAGHSHQQRWRLWRTSLGGRRKDAGRKRSGRHVGRSDDGESAQSDANHGPMFADDEKLWAWGDHHHFLISSDGEGQKSVLISRLLSRRIQMTAGGIPQYYASKWGVNGFLGSIYEGESTAFLFSNG